MTAGGGAAAGGGQPHLEEEELVAATAAGAAAEAAAAAAAAARRWRASGSCAAVAGRCQPGDQSPGAVLRTAQPQWPNAAVETGSTSPGWQQPVAASALGQPGSIGDRSSSTSRNQSAAVGAGGLSSAFAIRLFAEQAQTPDTLHARPAPAAAAVPSDPS
jgi:hypothetical protein